MKLAKDIQPGWVQLLFCKCPRCRQGSMFVKSKSYSKGFMKMNDNCPVCGDYLDKEVGFYYGSGFVSYALCIAISTATFIAWWVLIGISVNDNRVIYWLVLNAILLLVLQPPLMRLARTLWLAFFVRYDKDWPQHPPVKPQAQNDRMKNAW